MRGHIVFTSFERRWQLPVYFQLRWKETVTKLEEALALIESEYDLVLVDCAPSLNALTRTAWAASDRVAVVTEPGLFSVAAADRAQTLTVTTARVDAGHV